MKTTTTNRQSAAVLPGLSMPLRRAAAVLLGLCLSHAAIAQTTAARAPQSADGNSFTLAMDNDWLALSHRDADYSGGFMFTMSGPAASEFLLSLDPILGFIDGLWMPGSAPTSKSALQFGAQAYTPKDKKSHDVVLDDRPYAGLFSLTSTRMTVAGDADPVDGSLGTAKGFPVDVALGSLSYHELWSQSAGDAVLTVWYHTLNNGFRVPVNLSWLSFFATANSTSAVIAVTTFASTIGAPRVE